MPADESKSKTTGAAARTVVLSPADPSTGFLFLVVGGTADGPNGWTSS